MAFDHRHIFYRFLKNETTLLATTLIYTHLSSMSPICWRLEIAITIVTIMAAVGPFQSNIYNGKKRQQSTVMQLDAILVVAMVLINRFALSFL
jgi:hypothetical protein